MNQRLLLLVPTRTYRAEAFVAAAKRLSVDLSIASEEPSALSHLHPVSLPAFDFSDARAVEAFARDFALHNDVRAVVAVDDQATLAASQIAEVLGLRANSPEAVYATMNKFRMREIMRERGVDTPPFRRVRLDEDPRRVAGELDFPVVVKPLKMAASRGVIRANDENEFVSVFGRVAEIVSAEETDETASHHVLVEGFLPGWEVAVEGMLTDGRLDVLSIFDKPDPLDGPYFPETIYVTPSRLPESSQRLIATETQKVVDALGLVDGPIHAELRGTDRGATLIEIAARSIGGLCSKVLRFDGGLSLEDLILRKALLPDMAVPDLADEASGVMMMQPPTTGVFERADGVENARLVPGVDEVIISAHPGRRLEPLPEGFLYLGFIFARGKTPQAVETALREAYGKIDVVVG